MNVGQSSLRTAILAAIVLAVHAGQAADSTWEGAWSGKLGAWPISVTISQAKRVGFSENGIPLAVRYSKITPTRVTFGDQTNYSMEIIRTGDQTASMTVRGRHGVETGFLSK
jgi:hypothetical protein